MEAAAVVESVGDLARRFSPACNSVLPRSSVRCVYLPLAAVVGLADTPAALAESYPERTVEITVPSSPGATADMLGRVLAGSFSQQLGQPFIVVNKAAAARTVGSAAVAQAEPDGYTLVHGAAS